MQERDYIRFLCALYLFNDANSHDYDLSIINLRGLASYGKERKSLVDIIHWALMPNHFHLILRQKAEGGISAFMQKIGTGFSMYFNKKYERTGRLFEGSFKAKFIDRDEYLSHLSVYIPLNPLGLRWKQWKEYGVPTKELDTAKNYLRTYRWSSFNDYFGKSIIPNLVAKKTFFEVTGSNKQYKRLMDEYLTRGIPIEYTENLPYEA
ncbi:MAG: transposase [Patescibacteria group bacterium]